MAIAIETRHVRNENVMADPADGNRICPEVDCGAQPDRLTLHRRFWHETRLIRKPFTIGFRLPIVMITMKSFAESRTRIQLDVIACESHLAVANVIQSSDAAP